ncbi:hypothetical protein LTR27_001662 [Elasticomyces elasticus]|nr:hypothetical protein LTR27_001662 [Elasticomyces elasticus]
MKWLKARRQAAAANMQPLIIAAMPYPSGLRSIGAAADAMLPVESKGLPPPDPSLLLLWPLLLPRTLVVVADAACVGELEVSTRSDVTVLAAELRARELAVVVPSSMMLCVDEKEVRLELEVVIATKAVVVEISVGVVEDTGLVELETGALLVTSSVVDAASVLAGGVLLGAWLVVLGAMLVEESADDSMAFAFGQMACGPPSCVNANSTLWPMLELPHSSLMFAVMA